MIKYQYHLAHAWYQIRWYKTKFYGKNCVSSNISCEFIEYGSNATYFSTAIVTPSQTQWNLYQEK